MGLAEELGLSRPFVRRDHEMVLSVVFTGTLLAKEGRRILQPFGLTDAQFNILMLLKYQSEEGKINQTELSRMLFVNRSNVTGLIDRLEKAGFVRRTAAPSDRRTNYIELTEKGGGVLEKACAAYYERIEEIMSALSESDCRALCGMLESIRKRLNEKRSPAP